jgi:hypothetical protein
MIRTISLSHLAMSKKLTGGYLMQFLSKFPRLSAIMMLLCLLVACAGTAQIKEPCDPEALGLPILQPDTSYVQSYHVEAFCSETKIRTDVARVSWSADELIFDRQRLDVTTYKNGFEQGFFTLLCPLEEGQRFREAGNAQLPDRPDKQKLFLMVQKAMVDSSKNVITLEVEGLEPGLIYLWRVLTFQQKGWYPGGTKRVLAPVCPADEIQEIR